MSYHVAARRWARGWELHIDGVGVTQSRSLATAETTVRDYLALDDHDDAATAKITITPELDGDLATAAETAREATRHAEQARDEAAHKTRQVVRDLKRAGLSGSDVAVVLGVSTQRVSQLARGA